MRKNTIFLSFIILLGSQWVFSQIPNGYYNSANGLSGAPLKTALYNIINDHNVISYNGLWTAFQTTDDKPNGKVWDMYSDIPNGTPPYEYTFGSDQCGNYSGEGDCYNREHSFPQSWFAEASPMVSDLFHIYPTDGYVNNMRGNYPYGEVNSPTWTSLNGSKRGPCASAGYTGIVFEPIDEYKGDFARTYFYMATRYENLIASWQYNTGANEVLNGTSFPCYDQWFLDVIMAWHTADPVSQKEIDRNNTIYYSFQDNRNPYIDHPEYVSAVWGGTTILPEPTNHVLAFVISSATSNTITLTWNDNNGAQPAEKFLILANTSGAFTTPTDGIPVTDDLNMTDNTGAVNINQGIQTCTWSGLSPSTLYYFKIWPYTNSASDINYKTDGTVPQTNGSTQANPSITAIPSTLSGFSYVVGSGPSASVSYSLSGSGLQPASGNVIVSGSANYEVSTNNSTFSNSVNVAYTGGILPSSSVFVRLKAGLTAGNYNNEVISNTGGGASQANVVCNGNVTVSNTPQIVITSPLVNAGNVMAGADNHILYISRLDVSVSSTTLQQVAYQVNGTYSDADIKLNGFQLYCNSTGNFANAVLLGTAQSSNLSATGGLLTFSSLNTVIGAGNSLYIWLTADISANATLLHTLATAATTNASFVFSAGDKTGTQTAGGTQTIVGTSSLFPGDIAFTGLQTDDPDKFSFVLLKDFSGGINLKFTDNAWDETDLLSSEGTLSWNIPSGGLPKGTVVTVSVINGTPSVTAGSISHAGSFELSTSGDQLLAFQGENNSPDFISGISSGGWITAGNVNSNSSYLPPSLSLNVNALGFVSEIDNAFYSGPQTATTGVLRSLLNYPANFIRADEILSFPGWMFPLNTVSVIDINSEVKDLSINVPESLIINGRKTLTVHGVLTNNNGTGGFIVTSEPGGTGSLLHNTSGVQATIQRYITGDLLPGQHFYHLVSVPLVQSAGVLSGLFSGSFLFQHNESANSPGSTWTALGNSPSIPLNVNQGYRLYYPVSSGVIFNHAGELNNGTFTVPVNYTDADHGFNLVPNPYPSAISWDATSGWNKPALAGSIWSWNQGTGNYGAYVKGGSTNSASAHIPTGQSFFVQTFSGQPFTMNNQVRLHSSVPFTKNVETVENNLHLTVDVNTFSDEILVRFNDTSTFNYDLMWDARKLFGSDEAPQLCSVTDDGDLLSINTMPDISGELQVPLQFNYSLTDNITFTASGTETFNTQTAIYLEDLLLSRLIDLRAEPEYTFSHQAGNTSNRFRLRFSNLTDIPENNVYLNGSVTYANSQFRLQVPEAEGKPLQINIFNSLGQLISRNNMLMQGVIMIPAPMTNGMYIVHISSGNMFFTGKVIVTRQ